VSVAPVRGEISASLQCVSSGIRLANSWTEIRGGALARLLVNWGGGRGRGGRGGGGGWGGILTSPGRRRMVHWGSAPVWLTGPCGIVQQSSRAGEAALARAFRRRADARERFAVLHRTHRPSAVRCSMATASSSRPAPTRAFSARLMRGGGFQGVYMTFAGTRRLAFLGHDLAWHADRDGATTRHLASRGLAAGDRGCRHSLGGTPSTWGGGGGVGVGGGGGGGGGCGGGGGFVGGGVGWWVWGGGGVFVCYVGGTWSRTRGRYYYKALGGRDSTSRTRWRSRSAGHIAGKQVIPTEEFMRQDASAASSSTSLDRRLRHHRPHRRPRLSPRSD